MDKSLEDKPCKGVVNPDKYVDIFRTTPVNTVCPNFFILDHAHGCGFAPVCSYCFLKDSYYNYGTKEVFTDKDQMFSQLRDWVKQDDLECFVANSGNQADSLAFEKIRPIWKELITFFQDEVESKNKKHTLLAVTKGGLEECQAFINSRPCKNIIISFSINSPEAAKDHEKGAAAVSDRLAAANLLKSQGWRVRIRLDPMIYGYDYSYISQEILKLSPERVTLGTLRADPTLLPVVKGVDIFKLLDPPTPNSIARYPKDLRLQMYRPVTDLLKPITELGLCEETPDIWDSLGLNTQGQTCNCNL